MRWIRLARLAGVLAGTVFALAAIWAPQLGLDTNASWGPSRKLLLSAGIGLVVLAWAPAIVPHVRRAIRAAMEAGQRWVARSRIVSALDRLAAAWTSSSLAVALRRISESARRRGSVAIARSPLLSALFGSRESSVGFAVWAAFAVVAVSYLWYVSVGTWVRWPGTSAYQDMQAEAFLHGQTYLLREPEQDLLALPDPYDPRAREGIVYLWDASLFRGRYYLYWGPVPALLLVPFKALIDVQVGDDALTFAFSVGSLYWITRLLLRLWRDYFRQVPGWAVVGTVLAVGWANPATWILNSPWIYESAIAGGQFFLWMALYAAYPIFAIGRTTPLAMFAAGASLALAVGTRSSLAPAVVAVGLLVLLRMRPFAGGGRARLRRQGIALMLPLVLGAGALAGYNQIRFGSPLEFGHRYQLTSLDFEKESGDATSVASLPPNLYNYLINPVRLLPVFPYLKPHWGGTHMSVLRLHTPDNYYSRQVTGLILSSPFTLFGLLAVAALVRRPGSIAERGSITIKGIRWMTAAVLAATSAAFLLVQLYVVAIMRYLGDFTPGLMILAAIGFWQGITDRLEQRKPIAAFALLGLGLLAWTAAAGLLLGVTSDHARFEKLNPALFRWLERVFTL